MRYWYKYDILTTIDASVKISIYNDGNLIPFDLKDHVWIDSQWLGKAPRVYCKHLLVSDEDEEWSNIISNLPKNKYICIELITDKERTNMTTQDSKVLWSKSRKYWFFNK